MKSGTEREVKLRTGPGMRRVELAGRPMAARTLTSIYHDTDDLRLARAGITLRLRLSGEEQGVWQLKLPRDAAREELEWPAPSRRVPREVKALLVAHTRGRPLVAVATLRAERSGVVVSGRGVDIAEVVDDRVDVLADDAVVDRFEEIEVELVDGDQDDLERLERLLIEAGARTSDAPPKLFRALGGRPRSGVKVKARGARRVLARGLLEQYAELLAHDPGTRLGADPEALHDHRSAARRLRAQLRAGRPLLDRTWADELRAALKRVGRTLAPARDLDVLIAQVEEDRTRLPVRERRGAAGVVEALHARRARAQTELLAELSEPWYVSTLNRVEGAVAGPRFAGSGSLRRAVRNGRYAAELAAAGGDRKARRYAKRAKALQDVLGEHQDAVVATAMLTEVGRDLSRPGARTACAALVELQAERRAAARHRVAKGWKRLEARAV